MSVETLLSISEVSRMTGIATSKLRYLDRCGKLRPVKKAEGGHRYYTHEQVVRALKITKKQVVIAYTVLNKKEVNVESEDDTKLAAIKNNELIERVKKAEPNAKIAGVCDIWHGENKGLGIEDVIKMAINRQVSKVYYDDKEQFVVGDWNNYKYWLSLMDTELIDINDIEKRELV
ncbi:MAG: MerR family transcriptional regulator [Lachnospiraceae bacterium]|nr:MerR family transcriptional regulator [Lachnospiraceae bacterium]